MDADDEAASSDDVLGEAPEERDRDLDAAAAMHGAESFLKRPLARKKAV